MVLGFKRVPEVTGSDLSQVRIFLDAGHGGTDPGALGPLSSFGPMEKDVNLSIAGYAADFLRGKGAQLILTRGDDSPVSLAERMGIVAENKPDISLSIHANATAVSNDYNKSKGYRVYYTYGLPVSGQEDAVAFISRRAAELMGVTHDGPRQSNLALGRNLFCPSMIFEVGFMSNPSDYEWLLEEKNRKLAGEAIGMATLEWFQQLSASSGYDQKPIMVFVKGEELDFDVEPFIEEGRTLVPMRRIFEALGATVLWDEGLQTATGIKGDEKIVFKIGEKGYIINQLSKTMEVSAKIVEGGRTVVPLRVLSEAFGYRVDWNGETRTITIY
jgi:N-acetylmuramoyl-L-alanine amidase